MLSIFQATSEHRAIVRDLFHEYLHWVCPVIQQEYSATFDPVAILEHDMAELGTFMPPGGRLLLARDEDGFAGCACVRTIGSGMAEIKRMYVRPAFRRRGIGRALVDVAIAQMRSEGYRTMRLDSARFMTEAHALYTPPGSATSLLIRRARSRRNIRFTGYSWNGLWTLDASSD